MQTVLVFDWKIWLVVLIVLGVIVLDFLIGVLTNISTFSVQKFPSQLVTFILPYFVPLVTLAIVQFITPLLNANGLTIAVGGTFYVFAAATTVKAVDDILGKINQGPKASTSPAVVENAPPA